ncbi:MAG TPA: hypothetical protein VHY37_03545 [Tepidisphaeraceae bacterium]|jgi:hypothetical protein|nr:hypothetical protein [Tepidisphaeraceae bacterium]
MGGQLAMKISKTPKRVVLIAIALAVVASASCSILGDRSFQAAPFPLPASPIVVFRITGQEVSVHTPANEPGKIHGYKILQREVVNDEQMRRDIVSALDSRLVYGMMNAGCFEPGIAVRFGEGTAQVDAVICLSCQHVYFFRGGDVAFRNLNSTGVADIQSLYSRLFPGQSAHVAETDATTQR